MLNQPTYITKFFDPESIHYLQQGSIRFGSLSSYQSEEESSLEGRIDPTEGVSNVQLRMSKEGVSDIQIPGMFADKTSRIYADGASIGPFQAKGFVFSTCIGPYTVKQHKRMLFPSEDGYPGNPSLTGFVTFNAEKLFLAIEQYGEQNLGMPAWDDFAWLLAGNVTYGPKTVDRYINSGHRWSLPGFDEYTGMVFTKRPFFRPESEHRFVIAKETPEVPSQREAVIITHSSIIDAMITPPTIIPQETIEKWRLLATQP